MSKKGYLVLRIHELQSQKMKGKLTTIRIKADQTIVTVKQPYEQDILLPIADKVYLQILGDNEQNGYFELPMKKLYEFPRKRHLITVNCVTRDPAQGTVKPDIFGKMKLSVVYQENKVASLDICIQRLQIKEKKEGMERQLYIECKVGNVSSHTVVHKRTQGKVYEWNEVLPFTLESIPATVELIVKDKDMVNDELMGSIVLDPQAEGLFKETGKRQKILELGQGEKRIKIWMNTIFKIPQNQ